MLASLAFSVRQIVYDLRAGMLLRPGLITAGYAAFGAGVVALERAFPPIEGGLRHAWASGADAAASQIVLGTIAGSMMTIVSIVYSLLLMALSLASMQFSPRILTGFIADRVSQTTLGIFVGTFAYSLVVLRSIQSSPTPFVPPVAVSLGIALALFALAWLLYFIHHIGRGIHVNRIVDRIAHETAAIIDQELPSLLSPGEPVAHDAHAAPVDAIAIVAPRSGYIQLVDREHLVDVARAHRVTFYMRRAVGDFAVKGNTIALAAPADRVTAAVREACIDAFDLGEVRTMQQDVELGIRQIVDMALKAISPAVNDPSTAATCVDHLGAILCTIARRRCPAPEVRDEATGELLLVQRSPTFEASLDLAMNQLRQYGRGDMSVTLRLVRALAEVREATSVRSHVARVLHHAKLIEEAVSPDFLAGDRHELDARLRELLERCAAREPDAGSEAYAP